MAQITMHEVTRENWRATLQLAVAPDQQRFVAGYVPIALIALAKAYIRPSGLVWTPYAIYADDEPIGFTELAYEPESAETYWLFHFFIDQRYQGRGFGQQSLTTFIQYVKQCHPHCQALQLTVHPENLRAQRLYVQAGFRPTEVELDGEPVYKLVLSIP